MRVFWSVFLLRPTNASCSSVWRLRSVPAYFNRVLNSREEGLFPVVYKSNFFSNILLQDQPVCWFGLRQTLWKCAFMKFSYLMVQYRNWVFNRKECLARAASYLIQVIVLVIVPSWSTAARWEVHLPRHYHCTCYESWVQHLRSLAWMTSSDISLQS
jgi:hypothetical protein